MSERNPVICGAHWATTGHHCDEPVFKWLGDVGLCDHHYWRTVNAAGVIWLRQREGEYDYYYGGRETEADAAEVVYYVRRLSDGLIKIGTTRSFPTRLCDLRMKHGALQVLLTHRGDRATETAMHRKFGRLRVQGEFFRPRQPLIGWIVELRQRQPEATLHPDTLPMADLIALANSRQRVPIPRSKTG